MPGSITGTLRNRLLASLPPTDYKLLLPFLKPVNLSFQEILSQPSNRITHVYFPIDCFISMIAIVDTKHAVEVGLVGYEGIVGLPVALGAIVSPYRVIVQGGGTALRMKVSDFRREFGKSLTLRREVLLYAHMLMIQVAQTAACNRFHVVQSRMARWLLLSRDRVDSNVFRLTQEFLALMLGVRRVGVTLAAEVLQEQKLISYKRGVVTILDQKGLEEAACSCYKSVKDAYSQATRKSDRGKKSMGAAPLNQAAIY